MNINERSLVSGFFSIISARLITLVITILFTPLLVRLLGAGQYGDYAFVISILGLLIIVANSGVSEGIRKYLPEEDRPKSWQSDVFGFYTRISLILAFLVCFPIYTLSLFDFFGMVDDRFILYFQLLALIILFKQLYRVTSHALMGMGYEKYSEPIGVLSKGSFAVLALGFAYYGYGVTGVLIGRIISLSLVISVATVYLIRILDFRSIVHHHRHLPRKKLISFNFLTIILAFLIVSLYQFDIILLRLLAGDTQTGYYKAALVVAQMMWLFPKTLQALLLHSSSNYWSKENYEKLNTVASLASRFVLILTGLMAAGLIVLADDFIPLYFGSDFVAAVTPMLLLLPGVVGFALARPMIAIGQGSGKLRLLIYATGGVAVINIILNLLLIPLYGAEGAAIATSIGYGLMPIFHILVSREIGFDPISDLRLFSITFAILVSTIAMYSINQYISSSYLSLLTIPIVGTLVYTVLIFRTKSVSKQEVEIITNNLPDSIASPTNKFVAIIS